MKSELSRLGKSIDALISRYRAAERERQQLRRELRSAYSENRKLAERAAAAKERLRDIVARLPRG
jgi:hypothetical protein